MRSKRAIVITGTPGTGKSSVAEAVAKKTGAKVVNLNVVAAESGALGGNDDARGSRIVRTGVLRRALGGMLGDGKGDVVVEGHFGEIVPKGHVKVAIVLRTNPFVLRERLSGRGYSADKIGENVEAELLDACLIAAVEAFGEENVKEVDTTSLTPEEAADEVIRAVRGAGGLSAGSISWVTQLESEGRLRELIR